MKCRTETDWNSCIPSYVTHYNNRKEVHSQKVVEPANRKLYNLGKRNIAIKNA